MTKFFNDPILNSPYAYPDMHLELVDGQPTEKIAANRRRAEFITPIPRSKKQKTAKQQKELDLGTDDGLSTGKQKYDEIPIINELRTHVDQWRAWPTPSEWQVTSESARLLQHWRHHEFQGVRPFLCQVEAAIWLTEVAPPKARAPNSIRSKSRSTESTFSIHRRGKSAATEPMASHVGSSTPTTTKKASSSVTPTSSVPVTPTRASKPP